MFGMSLLTFVSLAGATMRDPGVAQSRGETMADVLGLDSPPSPPPPAAGADAVEKAQQSMMEKEGKEAAVPRAPTFARQKRWCSKCQLEQTKGTAHCDICRCCIRGHDHHCPWMGKCIGQRTSCCFYAYLVAVMGCILSWTIAFQMALLPAG